MIPKFLAPEVIPYVEILLAGLPPTAPTPTLTPRELALCVALIGKGWRLVDVIDLIQAQRPTLPFAPEERV